MLQGSREPLAFPLPCGAVLADCAVLTVQDKLMCTAEALANVKHLASVLSSARGSGGNAAAQAAGLALKA